MDKVGHVVGIYLDPLCATMPRSVRVTGVCAAAPGPPRAVRVRCACIHQAGAGRAGAPAAGPGQPGPRPVDAFRRPPAARLAPGVLRAVLGAVVALELAPDTGPMVKP